MLSRIISSQFPLFLRYSATLAVIRPFTTKPKDEPKKIPINPADYRLKKNKPCAVPHDHQKKKAEAKEARKKGEKRVISMYREGKESPYKWVDPKPGDTGLNENYDKVDAPNKANYKYTEYGYVIKGPEPTRYFDWERNGRVTDF